MSITKGPLNGIRVLDMTQAHAGPFGTMLLGDLGAEIIKLEAPTGELLRMGMPQVSVMHYYMIGLNRNKKGLTLDIKSELGKEAFYDLVRKSDIVFSNFRADVPKRQGTDFETLKKINPRIIRCNISGYGDTGPYVSYPAFDIIACGHSGILSISGEPGVGPVIPGGIAIADMMGGIFGSMSVLAALFKRCHDGQGMEVNVNLLDGLLVMQQVMFQNYFLLGQEPAYQGRRHTFSPGYGVFDTKDGYITLATVGQSKIIKLLDLGHLLDDPKYKAYADRSMNKEELNKFIEEVLLQKTTDEWVKLLRDENDIPCGPVLNFDQIVNDAQVLHNEMITEIELRGEKYKTIGSVFKMHDKTGDSIIDGKNEPPPDLGQHTEEILKDLLGYSDEQYKAIQKESEESIPRLKKRMYGSKMMIPNEDDVEEEKAKQSGK